MDFRQEFIEFALGCKVLRFGEFTTKAGRLSPYFFNAGLFNDGESLRRLSEFYANAAEAGGVDFDVLFGPAYKGIPLFDRIIAYIDDNIYDPLTIPEICEHFSLSRSALQLLFKNSVDQSPKKYINDKKLERSCQMLLENRYTISEISLRLGYSSIHYFSKSFNMKYHMSPSEFVKQNCQSSV